MLYEEQKMHGIEELEKFKNSLKQMSANAPVNHNTEANEAKWQDKLESLPDKILPPYGRDHIKISQLRWQKFDNDPRKQSGH